MVDTLTPKQAFTRDMIGERGRRRCGLAARCNRNTALPSSVPLVLLLLLLSGGPRVLPATSETVNADNGLYHDTGNGPCTRRVTVGGEADCYYSLKRLMSGTGIVNMEAKGLFQSKDGELVRYQSASVNGEWSLASLPDTRLAKSLHVEGKVRAAHATNFATLDARVQEDTVIANTLSMYESVRKLEVRDFKFRSEYAGEAGLTYGDTLRGFTAQQVETTIPAAVSIAPGQEVFTDGVTTLEVDAPKLVSYERLFGELVGAFQRLADQHDTLRADHDALQAEVTALKAQVKARDAADLADRLDLRALISAEASARLANSTSLSKSLADEEAKRQANVDKLTRDLAYVSRVFTTYDGNGFGL